MDVQVLGIDLGKNSCSLVGLDAAGRVVVRRRMRRESIEAVAEGLVRAGAARCVLSLQPVSDDVDDATDHAAVVDPDEAA